MKRRIALIGLAWILVPWTVAIAMEIVANRNAPDDAEDEGGPAAGAEASGGQEEDEADTEDAAGQEDEADTNDEADTDAPTGQTDAGAQAEDADDEDGRGDEPSAEATTDPADRADAQDAAA